MGKFALKLEQLVPSLDVVRSAIAGMTDEQLKARPVPGKMSTLEVICHLADFESVFADRVKRILAEDCPPIIPADEDCFLARLNYQGRDVAEELALMELTRRQLVRILQPISDSDWERIGRHTQLGEVSLLQIFEKFQKHADHHLPFIAEKRKALGC